jgi:hypothetical protein
MLTSVTEKGLTKSPYVLADSSYTVLTPSGESRTRTTRNIGGIEVSPGQIVWLSAGEAAVLGALVTAVANNTLASYANVASTNAAMVLDSTGF